MCAGFDFRVEVRVRYGKKELAQLMKFSAEHYDAKCRSLSQPGGFLYGMKNQLGDDKFAEWPLSTQDLDLLCKVTEPLLRGDADKVSLHQSLRELLFNADAKYRELEIHQ